MACGSDSSDSSSTSTTKAAASGGGSTTEKLTGKVNDKGTKSVVGKSDAELELEADDFYFEPTYIKVSPGQKVELEMKNEGDATHTFTSSDLGVDDELAPGAKKTVTRDRADDRRPHRVPLQLPLRHGDARRVRGRGLTGTAFVASGAVGHDALPEREVQAVASEAVATVLAFVEAFGSNDLDALAAVLADDFGGHVTTADGGTRTVDRDCTSVRAGDGRRHREPAARGAERRRGRPGRSS